METTYTVTVNTTMGQKLYSRIKIGDIEVKDGFINILDDGCFYAHNINDVRNYNMIPEEE